MHLNGGAASGECVVGVGCCTLVARCISGGGLQARANLNGGELDEGPVLPERGQPDVS